MKAIPIGKTPVTLLWCNHCQKWRVPVQYWERNVQQVIPEDHIFDSDYNHGSRYYETSHDSTLYQCRMCDQIVVNESDNDEHDLNWNTAVPWKCANCGDVWSDKADADECCT